MNIYISSMIILCSYITMVAYRRRHLASKLGMISFYVCILIYSLSFKYGSADVFILLLPCQVLLIQPIVRVNYVHKALENIVK